jgi:hypothetical protein
VVDPAAVIASALGAGGALGLRDSASSAVRDAYAALKALAAKKLASRPGADVVLARHEEDPGIWRAPLLDELEKAGVDRDGDLLAAAQALLALADETGTREGRYFVDARGSQGVVIGEYNNVRNVFRPPSAD